MQFRPLQTAAWAVGQRHSYGPLPTGKPAGLRGRLPQRLDGTLLAFKTKRRLEITGSGYVVQSLEVALWAFFHAEDFKEGTILAVNLGDDADTTGAVYGQLAGAFFGEQGVPVEWRHRLAQRDPVAYYGAELYRRKMNR